MRARLLSRALIFFISMPQEIFTSTEPLKPIDYADALGRQRALTSEGHVGWFLFFPKPVITIGRRTDASDVGETGLVPKLRVDRGGQATFHGPGQILGFPLGSLEAHTGDPRGVRDFICRLEKRLAQFVVDTGMATTAGSETETSRSGDGAGVWVRIGGLRRKIASIGLKFERHSMSHGFALNVVAQPELESLVNPCGVKDGPPQAALAALSGFAERGIDPETILLKLTAHLKRS